MREGVDHKKPSTLASDVSRIECHFRPLLGRKRIGAVTRADISQFLRDLGMGKARRNGKTRKHGRSIVRGGRGAASRRSGQNAAAMSLLRSASQDNHPAEIPDAGEGSF